jgi:hypothetical protein
MSDVGSITYGHVASVTLSNSANDPAGPFDALESVTGSGYAAIVMPDGSSATIYLVQGVIKAVQCARVNVTNTTATGIVGYTGATGTTT